MSTTVLYSPPCAVVALRLLPFENEILDTEEDRGQKEASMNLGATGANARDAAGNMTATTANEAIQREGIYLMGDGMGKRLLAWRKTSNKMIS